MRKSNHSENANLSTQGTPSRWTNVFLEDCIDILDSQRVPVNSKDRQKRPGVVPYYGATGQVGWIDSYLFDEELLLLGEDGAPFFDKSKRIGYIIEGKSWVNNHAHVLRAKPSVTTNQYLKYFLDCFDFTGFVSGTTRLKLNQNAMKKIPVPLPPINEQQRIVKKLEKLLAKVDNCKERLEKIPVILKRFRQAVLAAACSGELTKDWRIDKAADPLPTKMLEGLKDKKIQAAKTTAQRKRIADIYNKKEQGDSSSLPKGWTYVKLGKLCSSFQYGTSKKSLKVGKVAVLRMGNIQDGKIDWKKLLYTSDQNEIEKYILKPGTVLFNRTNSPELVGKTAIYRGDRPAIFAGYLIRIHNNSEVLSSEYLNYCLNSNRAKSFCLKEKTDGVSQSNINAQKLGKFEVPLCSVEEQKEIVKRVDALHRIADQLESRYLKGKQHIEKLAQSILAKAFRGELVSQDPNDEPASELLKRIQAERAQAVAAGKPKATRKRAQVKRSPRKRESKKAVASKPEPAPAPARPSRIEDLDDFAIMAAFRSVSQVQVGLPDDVLIRKISQFLGYGRLGKKIKARLQGAMHAAKIRKIIQTEHGLIYRATLSLGDYDSRQLIKSLRAVIKKGPPMEEAAAIRDAARYLGFQRVSAGMRAVLKAAILEGIDQGVFRREKGQIRRP